MTVSLRRIESLLVSAGDAAIVIWTRGRQIDNKST